MAAGAGGTKEMEQCSCGGDTAKCDFYPKKREEVMQNLESYSFCEKALGENKMNKPTLYILCGLPGCGKTTWTRNKMKENTPSLLKWAYVSRDEIRFSLIKENDEYFSKEKLVFKNYVEKIISHLEKKEALNIIADATHLNSVSRAKLIHSIQKSRPELEYEIVFIYFDVSLEKCMLRNSKRIGRARVPDEVLINMCEHFEFPEYYRNLKAIEIVRE